MFKALLTVPGNQYRSATVAQLRVYSPAPGLRESDQGSQAFTAQSR